MASNVEQLSERVGKVQHGFGDIKTAAAELCQEQTANENIALATALITSPVHQARMLGVFLLGNYAAQSPDCRRILREQVSQDPDWRVQEILAQAFEMYCSKAGYEKALPDIKAWLSDANPNVRRAASEGPRIWTSRPFFKQHAAAAIGLLSPLRADDSEYVRKSVGNALRDISRKHPQLIRAELETWDVKDRRVGQVYKLAAKFLEQKG